MRRFLPALVWIGWLTVALAAEAVLILVTFNIRSEWTL